MRPIPRYKLIWLNVPANTLNGSTIRFPDFPEIRGKQILGVEAYNADMLEANPDQVPCISAADMLKAVLTIRRDSTRQVEQIPLQTLFPVTVQGIWKEFVPFVPQWPSSDVTFVAAPAVTIFSVPLGVFYLD